MDIQIYVPSAKEKADGQVVAYIDICSLEDSQKWHFVRNLGNAKFVDPNYIIHDPSTHRVKVLLIPETTLRDIKQLLPNLRIKSNVMVGHGVSHEATLNDSFANLLKLANLHPHSAPRYPRPRL